VTIGHERTHQWGLLENIPFLPEVLTHPAWLISFLRDGGLSALPNVAIPGQGRCHLLISMPRSRPRRWRGQTCVGFVTCGGARSSSAGGRGRGKRASRSIDGWRHSSRRRHRQSNLPGRSRRVVWTRLCVRLGRGWRSRGRPRDWDLANRSGAHAQAARLRLHDIRDRGHAWAEGDASESANVRMVSAGATWAEDWSAVNGLLRCSPTPPWWQAPSLPQTAGARRSRSRLLVRSAMGATTTGPVSPRS